MEINALNLTRIAASTAKLNAKSSDASSFNKIFESTSQAKQTSQDNQVRENYQDNQDKSKGIEKPKNDDLDNSKNKPLSKEEKAALKEAGMSDEEIDSIKSEKDLKETIIKKLLGGDSKDNEDLSSLLAMLMTLMNGKFDNADYSKIKDFAKQNADKLIGIIADCVSKGMSKDDLMKNSKNTLNPDILKLFGDLQDSNKLKPSDVLEALNSNGDDILKNIQLELSNVLKDNLKDLNSNGTTEKIGTALVDMLKSKLNDANTNKTEEKDLNKDKKLESQNVLGEKQTNVLTKTDKKSSETNLSMENSNSKSDEDFLKNLLSDNSSDKISKVTNFMAQFNSNKVENANVAGVENLVINKNNLSADIIKTVKYMEINNIKDLTVKINPKELGEVVIKLTMESGAMKATITASNKEAFNLLNSNLVDMTNKLQNSDMKIESLSLNIYNEDTTFFKDGSNNQRSNEENKGRKNHAVGAISEEETDNLSAVDNNVNILA